MTVLLVPLTLVGACASPARSPGIHVETVEVVREVQMPCPVEKPVRPTPLGRPLPTDLVALAAVLGAALAEWAGPGGYGERADAVLTICTTRQ